MADSDQGQDKTEDPTDKRLGEAREKGQVPRSVELTSGVSIVVSFSLLITLFYKIYIALYHSTYRILSFDSSVSILHTTSWLTHYALPAFGYVLLFLSLIALSGIVTSIAQTGWVLSWKSLNPDFSRVNPFAGLKRIFSTKGLFQTFKAFIKVIFISLIVYSIISDQINALIYSVVLPLQSGFAWSKVLWIKIIVRVSWFLLVLAIIDFIYQKYTFHKQMMMTRQEVKDEYKQQNLPDHIKAKVKQVAKERAKRTIHKEVPNADVIITNPTHYAVAIRYDRSRDIAPRVVAKGKDLLAKMIRDLAKDHQVPIYEFPELARALYKKVNVGKLIPVDLYESAAKVLAWVYRVYHHKKKVS